MYIYLLYILFIKILLAKIYGGGYGEYRDCERGGGGNTNIKWINSTYNLLFRNKYIHNSQLKSIMPSKKCIYRPPCTFCILNLDLLLKSNTKFKSILKSYNNRTISIS